MFLCPSVPYREAERYRVHTASDYYSGATPCHWLPEVWCPCALEVNPGGQYFSTLTGTVGDGFNATVSFAFTVTQYLLGDHGFLQLQLDRIESSDFKITEDLFKGRLHHVSIYLHIIGPH